MTAKSPHLSKRLMAGAIFSALLHLCVSTWAADRHFQGSVWTADFEQLVVRSRPEASLTFAVRYDAVITLNGSRVKLEQLRRWDSVRITAHERGNALVATRIDAWSPL